MRVNISYSLEFDKIPNEVAKFIQELRKNQHKIQFLYDDALLALENQDTVSAARNVESIRRVMVETDAKLQDCSGILEGYQKALVDLASQAAQEIKGQQKQEEPSQQEVENPKEDGGDIEEG